LEGVNTELWRRIPQLPEGNWALGVKPPASGGWGFGGFRRLGFGFPLGDFYDFSAKITHF